MPTPKQVRYHYGRIHKAVDKLRIAIRDADSVGLLTHKDYQTESPYKTLWETRDRIDAAAKDQLVAAMRTEILEGK